jgi:hypothetical protein
MKISKLAFAALLLLASVPLALAQGTYTQIDYPGAGGWPTSPANHTMGVAGGPHLRQP